MKNNRYKIISTVLIFALVLTMIPTKVLAESVNNVLVKNQEKTEHWAGDMIESFISKGYIEDKTLEEFSPDKPISRGEFASLIYNVTGLEKTDYNPVFLDVNKNTENYYKIIALYEKGWIKGYPDNNFKPNKTIDRYEAATIIFNLLELKEDSEEEYFTDCNEFPSWVRYKLNTLAKNNFFTGYKDKSFRGEREMLNSEAVAFLYRSSDTLIKYAKDNKTETKPSVSGKKHSRSNSNNSGSDGGQVSNPNKPDITSGSSIGYNGRVYKEQEVSIKQEPINSQDEFDVTSIMPNHGTLGTYVTLRGQNFTEDFTDFKVYFEGKTQGKTEAQIVDYKNGEVVVISPIMEVENYKVYVETQNITSYKYDFTGESLDVNLIMDSANDLIADTKELIDSTIHEIQIAYTPELEGAASSSLINDLNKLKTDLDNQLAALNNSDSEVVAIFNQLMATEALVKQKADINTAIDLLNHSTASESLDNINTALKTIKEVHSTLKTARTWMRSIGTAMIIAGTIGSIFSFGATSGLAVLGKSILTFCETVLTPVISTLTGIIFVLECVPSYAVGDSFETRVVSDNYGLNEGFSSLREILGQRSSTNDLYETALRLRTSTIQLKSDIDGLYSPLEAFGVDLELLETVKDDNVLDQLYKDMKESKSDAQNLDSLMSGYTTNSKLNSFLSDVNIYINLIENDASLVYTNRDSYNYIFTEADEIISEAREISDHIKTDAAPIAGGVGGIVWENIYSFNLQIWSDTILEKHVSDFEARKILIKQLFDENRNASDFSQIEILPAEIMDTNAGVIYVGRDLCLKGTMDFEGSTNEGLIVDEITGAVKADYSNPISGGLEYVIGGAISWFVDDIIGDIFDFDIDLTDVDVKLKLESEDESIVSGQWDGDKLVITGHKPGMAKVKVIADIEQVTGKDAKIPIESASITRTYVVMSGTQTQPPYTLGPRIDKITNLETMEESPFNIAAYIGDLIKIEGFGFSKDVTNHQNVYMQPLENYNDTGILEKRYFSNTDYTSFQMEVPDTCDGSFYVTIGEDQDDSPTDANGKIYNSNIVNIDIKNNELHSVPSSAIVGEVLNISGKGFSHYGKNNLIEFLDENDENIRKGIAHPVTQSKSINGTVGETTDSINDFGGTVNCDFHENLTFKTPDIEKDTMYNLDVNTLNNRFLSNKKPVMVRKFSESESLESSTLRPDIAVNESNSDMTAVYMDLSDNGGFALMGAFANGTEEEFKEVNLISSNIGGIETAPDEPYIDYELGTYGVVWIGKDSSYHDDVFFTFSNDGKNWSGEMNISNVPYVSAQPKIKLSDIDNDSDADALIVYTQNGAEESEDTQIKLAVLENTGSDFELRTIKDISINDGAEPSIDSIDNHLVIAYSEAPSMGSQETYNRKINSYEADINNFDTINVVRNVISNIAGKVDYCLDTPDNLFLYATANYPEVALYKDGDNYKTYYVWEQTKKEYDSHYGINDFKSEEVYFAAYENGSEAIEPKNISNTIKQSQDPKVSVDDDGVVSVAFIETGVYEQSYAPHGFTTEVYFTRTFDDGETFTRPYMELDAVNGRIGHINLESYDSGHNTVIYEKHDDNDIPTVCYISTNDYEYNKNKLDNMDENNEEAKYNEYIIRTYADKTVSDIPLVAYEQPTGDIVISKINGENSRKIVRNNSTVGRISSTHDGRYLYYTQKWLMQSEADGSHPIRLSLGEWENCYIGAYISPNDKYLACSGTGEMIGTGGFITVDTEDLSSSTAGWYAEASNSMWATSRSDDYMLLQSCGDWWTNNYNNRFNFSMYNAPANQGDAWPAVNISGSAIAYIDTDKELGEYDWDYLNRDKYFDSDDLYIRFKEDQENNIKVDSSSSMPVFSLNNQLLAYVKKESNVRKLRIVNINDLSEKAEIDLSKDLFKPWFTSDNSNLLFNTYDNGNVTIAGVPVTPSPVGISIGGNISSLVGTSGEAGLLTITKFEKTVEKPIIVNDTEIIIEPDEEKAISQTFNEGESGYVEISLAEAPTKPVKIFITYNGNDAFDVDGLYVDWSDLSNPVYYYPKLVFDSTNYNIAQRFTYTCREDEKVRGQVTGDLEIIISSDDDLYYATQPQKVTLTAVDND
ncbi:S-layer homology domain-containing protein [Anaerovorax odorimutans]|uniref:S-layer homology domain-containing protein n=1 Tax=Anaerovorax odorimutans TaxID=109327 RepID=UPI00040CD057|nr:S-layer homology domain-containing protein [Anaerovorax odorimutans]